MQISMDDLTVDFSHIARESLLQDWVWLIGESLLPILVTASGDAFLQDPDSGSIYFLDTQPAEVIVVANDLDEFRALLGDARFVRDYLGVDMVADLMSQGRLLGPGQVYDLVKPMVLGGEFEFENIEPKAVQVHFSILGQIHQQVSKLPPGTKISGVNIE